MPPKKATPETPRRGLGGIRTRQETLVNQVVAQVTNGFDDKFNRLENAIAAMAARPVERDPPPQKKKTTNNKRKRVQPPQLESDQDTDDEVGNIVMQEVHIPPERQAGIRRKQGQPPRVRQTLDPRPDVQPTVNTGWKAWIDAQHQRPAENIPRPLSVSDMNFDSEDDIQHILSTTAHQLARGNQRPGLFPHKYISRGPEQRRATLNSLSLPEYNWATLRMIKDSKVLQEIKPFIISHLEEVNEDACDYDWPTAVRRWSEEVYTQIAENRLPAGWASSERIQFLRLTTSRISTARLTVKENIVRPRQYPSATATNQELYKGGPPCQQFNSAQGCRQQSGHIGQNGVKLIHVCAYCLINLAAVNLHSESVCRNKARRNFNNANHF